MNVGSSDDAVEALYEDAVAIYERARAEVTIERSDGRRQEYAATRYRQQIERGYADNALVPTVALIVRRLTTGFNHLADAQRPDLMLETLVVDERKPYHRLFTQTTIDTARARLEYAAMPRSDQ